MKNDLIKRADVVPALLKYGVIGLGSVDETKRAISLIEAADVEQEPRVMTEEELKRIEPDSVYWGEGYFVRNLWPMVFTAEAIQDLNSGYLRDSYGRAYELDLYNKDVMGWRIWTARPTEDQREAVKWDAQS